MGTDASLGFRLRHARELQEKTQKVFAGELGVSVATLQNYESGKRVPDADFLLQLVDAGYSSSWILTGEGSVMRGPWDDSSNRIGSLDRIKVFISSIFDRNKELGNYPNPVAVFLAAFDTYQIDAFAILAAETQKCRESVIVDAAGKSDMRIIAELLGSEEKDRTSAYDVLEESFWERDRVLVIKYMSQAMNLPCEPDHWARSLIRMTYPPHGESHSPRSDIVFVDYASFLERGWSTLEPYICHNLVFPHMDTEFAIL